MWFRISRPLVASKSWFEHRCIYVYIIYMYMYYTYIYICVDTYVSDIDLYRLVKVLD